MVDLSHVVALLPLTSKDLFNFQRYCESMDFVLSNQVSLNSTIYGIIFSFQVNLQPQKTMACIAWAQNDFHWVKLSKKLCSPDMK